MKPKQVHLYFVKPVDLLGPIKIGRTDDVARRMQSFRRYSPVRLEMILFVPGSIALERAMHERFASAQSHYEWFHPVDDLVSGIEALKRGLPIEEAFDLSIKTGSIRKNAPGIMARFTPQYKQRLKYVMKVSQNIHKTHKNGRYFERSDLLQNILHPDHSQTFLTPEEIAILDTEINLMMQMVDGRA